MDGWAMRDRGLFRVSDGAGALRKGRLNSLSLEASARVARGLHPAENGPGLVGGLPAAPRRRDRRFAKEKRPPPQGWPSLLAIGGCQFAEVIQFPTHSSTTGQEVAQQADTQKGKHSGFGHHAQIAGHELDVGGISLTILVAEIVI